MKKIRDWWMLLWPILPLSAGFAILLGLREWLPANGMRILMIVLLVSAAAALLWWTFRSPNRSIGYLIQIMGEDPSKRAKGLPKLLSSRLEDADRERLMNTDFSQVSGVRRLKSDAVGRALMQLWIGDSVYFARLAHAEKGRYIWSIESFWANGESGDPVPDAKTADSPFRHSRNVHMTLGMLSGVAAFFICLSVFTSGDRIDRMMEEITNASVTALRGNIEMELLENLPAELVPFQDAVREMTDEIQENKMGFEESLESIRYGDVLNAQALSQDRDFGLENILMTLRRGEDLAEEYFARMGAICNQEHMQELLNRHGVDSSVQSRYLSGRLYYFDIGDTSRFLKVYQYTTELGEILQDHLDAWSIDEKNQLIFEDESVMDQYNTVFFEMQRLLQDADGSALT